MSASLEMLLTPCYRVSRILLPTRGRATDGNVQPLIAVLDSGQGGGQSIEDAAALGVLLSDLKSKSEIQQRLRAFETLRLKRASAIQILSSHGQDQAYKSQKMARPYVDGHIPGTYLMFFTSSVRRRNH